MEKLSERIQTFLRSQFRDFQNLTQEYDHEQTPTRRRWSDHPVLAAAEDLQHALGRLALGCRQATKPRSRLLASAPQSRGTEKAAQEREGTASETRCGTRC